VGVVGGLCLEFCCLVFSWLGLLSNAGARRIVGLPCIGGCSRQRLPSIWRR
jgi:hypothetical protein